MHAQALRAQLEARGLSAPRLDVWSRLPEMASTGIPLIDQKTGGIPRGRITEITGPVSSGRTQVYLSILAAATEREEVCALVDGTDTFDPHSGQAAGIHLDRVLWVRCTRLDDALKSADLLLQGGGFGQVILDLAGIPRKVVRTIPSTSWIRFQRAIEKTPTCLTVVAEEASVRTCAWLAVKLKSMNAAWSAVHKAAPPHGKLMVPALSGIDVLRRRS